MLTQSKAIAKGVLSYLPKVDNLLTRESSKTTQNARYCYSVWLRHLVHIHKSSNKHTFPTVVELGPGSSIATGLIALLTGTNKYLALDVVDFTKGFNYDKILDELILLLKNRTPIPNDDSFIGVHPKLDDYSFPDHILPATLLAKTMHPDRIKTIKSIVKAYNESNRFVSKEGISIQFIDSWDTKADKLPVNIADLVISQGVLMMAEDVDKAYEMVSKILKKGGVTSNQYDLGSLNTSDKWNGHYTYSDFVWNMIKGQRSFLINRIPYSEHVILFEKNKMKVIGSKKAFAESKITRKQLAKRFRGMPDEDLITRGALILAVKE